MKVLIVGGGIAGLTLAHALQQKGIDYDVYEAAPRLEIAGAGITLAPNALAVLDRLGLVAAVSEAGAALKSMDITDEKMRPVQSIDMEAISRVVGQRSLAIHRGRLQQVLLAGLPAENIHTGKRLSSLEETSEGIIARFEDGTAAGGDLLVGADGIHSAVRKAIFPKSEYRYSGQTCWRGVAPLGQITRLQHGAVEAWGKQARFGMVDIGHGEAYWFAVLNAPEGGQDDRQTIKNTLLERFASFGETVRALISGTPDAAIYRSDIRDLKRLDSWSKGRVCLMGDAAHATTPNMGQGGCQAMEDAWFLAQELANQPTAKAFRSFELRRRKKVDLVVNQSWLIGKIAHVPFGRGLRNALFRATPASVTARSFEALYRLG